MGFCESEEQAQKRITAVTKKKILDSIILIF